MRGLECVDFGWFCAPGQPGGRGFGLLLVGKIKNFGNGVDVVTVNVGAGVRNNTKKKLLGSFQRQ